MPSKLGLMIAGHQQDIPETALWRAKNVVSDTDGLMQKRPALTQWGQTLMQPDASATGSTITAIVDLLASVGSLIAVDTSAGLITTNLDKSYLQFNVPVSAGSETLTYYYPGTSSSTKWGLRLSVQGTNLPAYTAASTTPNSLTIRAIAAAGTGKEFVLWSDGLYYKRASDNQYTLIEGTELLGQGAWKTIEIRCDDGANTLVYIDDLLVDTIASSLIKDVSLTAGALFEIAVRVPGASPTFESYNARVAMLMYNDTDDDPFIATPIVSTTDFVYQTAAGSTQHVVLVAAGNYIYLDRMEQSWRPLLEKQRTNVFFTTYQRTLIWSDNDGGRQASVWQWDGLSAPELLDNAPNFVLMTEHQLRLAGVDRDNPLMLLLSGDRKPNVYLDPDNLTPDDDLFDTLLDAVAVPIPAKKSDVITAIWGDYYGSLIIWTTSSVWRLTGNGVFSYALSNISQSAGCVNAYSVAMVGNDLWFAGPEGIHSLQATDQFGDIQAQYPSAVIQSMWQQSNRSPLLVNQQLQDKTRMAHHRSRSLVYITLPIAGTQVMAYNTATQQWLGPWDTESVALASVKLTTPITEVVFQGGSTGKVAYYDHNSKLDYRTTQYETVWEWAALNGRSLDSQFIGMMKTWRLLRLFYLPRGDFNYQANWYASIEEGYRSETHNQRESFPALSVDSEMRVDVDPDAQVYSSEELSVSEIDLDVRGYSLDFNIVDNDNLNLLGFEVEFDADGYEAAGAAA